MLSRLRFNEHIILLHLGLIDDCRLSWSLLHSASTSLPRPLLLLSQCTLQFVHLHHCGDGCIFHLRRDAGAVASALAWSASSSFGMWIAAAHELVVRGL